MHGSTHTTGQRLGRRAAGGALCAALALASCASSVLMPSEFAYLQATPTKVANWLDECEFSRNDYIRQERHCTLVIKSDTVAPDVVRAFAYAVRGTAHYEAASWPDAKDAWARARLQDAVSDFTAALRLYPDDPVTLNNRGLAYTVLGQDRRAESDFRLASWYSGNDDVARAAREWARERDEMIERERQEREAARRWAIRFEGIWCGAIGNDDTPDALFNPASELRVQTIVYGRGVAAVGAEKPSRNAVFEEVRPGYRSQRGRGRIWVGPDSVVDMSVILWEKDGGRDDVKAATTLAIQLGLLAASASGGSSSSGYSPAAAGGPGPADLVAELIDDAVGDVIADLLGVEDDHLGTHHWTTLDVRDWAESETRSQNGFSYHISTRHQGARSDCRTYYTFHETDPAT